MRQPELSVVVPVYNNAATLDELIDRQIRTLEGLGDSFELIFVDDGSRDGSLALLRRRAEADPRIRSFALVRNFGSQAAVCAGFDQVRGRRTILMDADLENFPEDIPALLAALDEEHDLACGVRVNRQDSFLWRRLPSKLMNAYVRQQTGTRVRDIGCAYRAMDSRLIRELASEGEHRRLLTPLLLRRARSVVEVPVQHRPKGVPGGHTFFTLLGIAMDYYLLTAKRPFVVTGVLSALAVAAGLLTLAITLGGSLVVGLLLVVGGAVGGLLSLVGEYAQRIYQIGQDLPFYQLQQPEKAEEAAASAQEAG
jgi:glycosyltransferase involved in cell wall biosynthesis